jgi:sec-independent protein translocase protein TatA
MLGIGFPELVVILVLLLIVFRPEQLVEMVRAVGGLAGQFWQAGQEIREQIEEELARTAEWERSGPRPETPPPPIALAPPAEPPAAESRKPEG